MHRRKFIQFMGASMVGVSLAMFGTGLVSSPVAQFLPGLDPESDNHLRFHDNIVEEKWIGSEMDTFDSWAESWAKMSGRTNVFLEVK